MRYYVWLWLLVGLAVPMGCQPPAKPAPAPTPYQTVAKDPTRDSERARQEDAQGVECLKAGNLEAAEKHLKAALTADMFFGPAHANLGTVYYCQKRFYLAAWEYQYAASLMPYDPRPRNNLGLVFEMVGQMDKAAASYEEALKLAPDNPEYLGNLARVYVRRGQDPQKLRAILTDLVARETRPQWATWARERLALLGGAPETPTAPTTAPSPSGPASQPAPADGATLSPEPSPASQPAALP